MRKLPDSKPGMQHDRRWSEYKGWTPARAVFDPIVRQATVTRVRIDH
jgi:hypothetical protein